ncbi:FAST kinase domain-containing protein 5, mitochondrial isoform X2 [Cylas formicarius]|uniref:FAST kinase domain-containing protein 5, mitochondrial isoform X2 n=1 Tax=Cylas formicarius TaxID=197179 RepID=UPI002958AE9C|nr:FAST kinase domain-containing protein 5, mitochondrial isoform X2 [Cylas formicarius]
MLTTHKLHKATTCSQLVLKFRSLLAPLPAQNEFSPNVNRVSKRWFHPHFVLKHNVESENDFMFSIVRRPWVEVLTDSNDRVNNEEEFSKLLDRDWRSSNASDIVSAFKRAKQFCFNNNVPISDERFNKLVDGLMDHCDKLKYEDIIDLMQCLSEYPPCESYKSRNMHDVFSCLDDVCCWKMQNWSMDQLLTVADLWYKFNLAKIGDFIYLLLNRKASKAHHLTKDQLVRVFFFFNVCRKKSVDFNYECAVENKIKEMNIDEMAVVAIGYFKTRSKFRSLSIMQTMIEEVLTNSKSVHEISLTAILKILRYSSSYKMATQICKLVNTLYHEIDRLSDMACLHLMLLAASFQMFHEKMIQKGAAKLGRNIDKIRSKDIERLLYVLTMFDYKPNIEPDIFKAAYEEILSDKRLWEVVKYPRIFLTSLYHLSIRDVYSYHWMNKIFDEEYIKENFGKGAKNVPRLLYCLDVSARIDCPDYKGKRLSPNLAYKAAKWNTCYTPTHDIILCKDKLTDNFVEPVGFQRYIFGDVMIPHHDDNLKWYAIVVIGPDHVVRDTSMPLAAFTKKLKQLQKIGYNPVPVTWREFMPLPQSERKRYISANLR